MMNDDDFSHVTHGGSIFSYHEIPIQTKTTKKGYNPYSFEQSYYLIKESVSTLLSEKLVF